MQTFDLFRFYIFIVFSYCLGFMQPYIIIANFLLICSWVFVRNTFLLTYSSNPYTAKYSYLYKIHMYILYALYIIYFMCIYISYIHIYVFQALYLVFGFSGHFLFLLETRSKLIEFCNKSWVKQFISLASKCTCLLLQPV